jgi:ABC-2 type transport system ATP-binding protein
MWRWLFVFTFTLLSQIHPLLNTITRYPYKVIFREWNKEEKNVIEINHLVKKYGSHVAVDDLSLTVEPGRIYGFLGPNGAGKSTTMNIITGYLAATGGEVKINGFDVLKQPEEAKKCVGYLPELPPLYMDMTVKEYLDFVAELKKLDKSLRAGYVKEAMKITRTEEVSGRLIRNLSKGYRQRVGFAQAVLGYPEILILDEPTVGLDPKQIIEIRDLIKELGKKHTIILSSHILSEISAVCDHVFIISHGKLVASDSTENLLERMTGAQEIELLVKAEEDTAETAIREVAQVERCEKTESKEDGAVQLLVTAKKDADVREAIYHTCVEHHMPILEMKAASKSLEDVFLELTSQEGGTK